MIIKMGTNISETSVPQLKQFVKTKTICPFRINVFFFFFFSNLVALFTLASYVGTVPQCVITPSYRRRALMAANSCSFSA